MLDPSSKLRVSARPTPSHMFRRPHVGVSCNVFAAGRAVRQKCFADTAVDNRKMAKSEDLLPKAFRERRRLGRKLHGTIKTSNVSISYRIH